MKFGLAEITIHKINMIFEKYPEVEQVLIYGSRAKGNYREGSDIDLTLKGEKLNTALQSRIYWEIDALNTPYLVDLSIYHKLDSTELTKHIDRLGKVFYSKKILHKN